MQLTHLGHAAVLVEVSDRRILIDPGNFSSAWHGLRDLDVIAVTHQHGDHLDAEAIGALLEANPGAALLLEPDTEALVRLARGRAFAAGQTFTSGAVTIEAVGGVHAQIHPDIPRVGNVGLLVRAEGEPTFFHPGDSLDVAPLGVDVLAVPGYGPWAAMAQTVDFARAVAAPFGFIIHEGLLSERGFALVFNRVADMSPTSMVDLREGAGWQVPVTPQG